MWGLWPVGLLQPDDFIFWLRIWRSYKQEYSMFEVVRVTWKWVLFLNCTRQSLWPMRVSWNCAIWLWLMPLSSFLGLEISEMSTRRWHYSVIPLNCWVWRFGMNTLSSHQIQLLDVWSLCLQGLLWCVWSNWEIWFGMTELFQWTNHLLDKHKKSLLDLSSAISYIVFIVA